jgi:hypothetical protein
MICWAHHNFFSAGWKSQGLTALAMIAAMVCFFTSITVLFLASWLAYMGWMQLQAN